MARASGGVTRKPSDATTTTEADIQATASHNQRTCRGRLGRQPLQSRRRSRCASQTFEFWLDVLELIDQDELDEQDQMFCALYIRSLRRRAWRPAVERGGS